jgi:uncharacterized membrane protein
VTESSGSSLAGSPSQPNVTVQVPANQIQQSPASNGVALSANPLTISPTDVGSLTAKEILAANNQAVSQVASMYQYFGLFITIIVTLLGGFGVILGFVARRSLKEFIQEWDRKLQSLQKDMKESLEKDMKESLERLHDSVSQAEDSANKAAEHAQSIMDTAAILDKVLRDVDTIRAKFTAVNNASEAESYGETPGPAAAEASVEPSPSEEDAEVAARLEGKIELKDGEA